MSPARHLLGRSAVLALQKLLSGGGPLLAIVAAGTFAAPGAVAAFAFQWTLAQLVVVLADLGASRLIPRELDDAAPRRWSLPWLLLIRLVLATSMWALILLGPWAEGQYLQDQSGALGSAVAWSLLGTISMAFYGLRLVPESLRPLAIPLRVGALGTFLFVLLTFLATRDGLLSIALGLAGGRALEASFFLVGGWAEFRGGSWRGTLAFCRDGLPLLGQQATSLLYGRGTVLAAAAVLSPAAYALFNVARSIYGMASLVPASFAHSSYPQWVRSFREGGYRAVEISVGAYLRRALPIHAAILAPMILILFFFPWKGVVMADHRLALSLVGLTNLLSVFTATIGFRYLAIGADRRLLGLSIANAVVGFLLTIILCSTAGANGAIASILVCDLVTIGLFQVALPKASV